MNILGIVAASISGNLNFPGKTWTSGAAFDLDPFIIGPNAITYGGGIYLSIGYGTGTSLALRSTNGTTFTAVSRPAAMNYSQTLLYDNSQFIGIGTSYSGTTATVFTSSDGLTWTTSTITLSGTTAGNFNIGQNLVGKLSGYYYSPGSNNGVGGVWYGTSLSGTWTHNPLPDNDSWVWWGFNNGSQIMMLPLSQNFVYKTTSPATSWSKGNTPNSVGWNNHGVSGSRFFVGGAPGTSHYYSDNLTSFTAMNTGTYPPSNVNYWYSMGTGNGTNAIITAPGENIYSYSTNNGSSWTTGNTLPNFTTGAGGGGFVQYAGSYFYICNISQGFWYCSPSTPQTLTKVATSYFNSADFSNTSYYGPVSNGSGVTLIGTQSSPGKMYRFTTSGASKTITTPTNYDASTYSPIWDNGSKFWALKNNNSGETHYYSSNGTTWTSFSITGAVDQLASNGSAWVAGKYYTNQTVWYWTTSSPTSVTTSVNLPQAYRWLRSNTAGEIWTVGTDNPYNIYYTTNGSTWTTMANALPAPTSGSSWAYADSAGDKNFVMNSGEIAYSTNNSVSTSGWTKVSIPGVTAILSVAFGLQTYVIVANSVADSSYRTFYSKNLSTWTQSATYPSDEFTDYVNRRVAFDGTSFIGVKQLSRNVIVSS